MRASDADRERFAKILHDAMGEGRITMAELEERLDAVYAAKTLPELEPIVADLPVASAVQPAAPRTVAAPENRIGGNPGSTTSIAVMSGAVRKGDWVVPPQHNSFAFWGGVDIDLRKARFAQKRSTITAVAIMGGIEIVVPDDVVVDVTGIGIMGDFSTTDRGPTQPPPPDAPVVKINGFAFWGAVEVIRKPRKNPKEIERPS
ncbi:DUF1707 SHOCT-like domain-containing protein [Amycolatopsis anabasis]|uniref:DUF1707 SHOCT-like domain-containing protein n=1 Tax=Amycolatopsis anabasis TaxID=1840409 RepID=UPI00131AD2C1|nr:DUF1707 domain-containing protein [Amycolatopsis anabasis]